MIDVNEFNTTAAILLFNACQRRGVLQAQRAPRSGHRKYNCFSVSKVGKRMSLSVDVLERELGNLLADAVFTRFDELGATPDR